MVERRDGREEIEGSGKAVRNSAESLAMLRAEMR